MTFTDALALIPFNPERPTATGLWAPIVRSMGHILYVTGLYAEPTYELSDEEAIRELDAAASHLTNTLTTANAAPISARAKTLVFAWVDIVHFAHIEYAGWPDEERGANLKAMADRAAALAAFFDVELAAVTGSDPGRSL